jgi:YVTN family beta-propeller protein
MSSSDGRTAYVTNEGSNDVSVVDLTSRTVMATIAVSNAVLPGPGAALTPAAQSRAAASPRGKSKSVTLGGVA